MNAAVDGDMFTYALVSELVVSKINVVCAAGTNPNFRKLVAGLFEYLSDQKISCDRIAGDDEVIVSNYNMRLDDQAFGTDRGQSVRDWIFANAR